MPTLHVVTGMPGSGKSELTERFKNAGTPVFDDYHSESKGRSEAFEDAREFNDFQECLTTGKDCVLVEVAYCWQSRRENLSSS